MKIRFLTMVAVLFLGLTVLPVSAAYSSLRIFGDSLSSTTSNTVAYPLSTNYYGHRFSNGRVWVEVLAQQQGLPYAASNNISFFGNYSSTLFKTVTNYVAPADVSTALYVVWVNNADLFDAATYDGNNLSQWTADINRSQTNHFKIITNLWSKGVRTLIMPNAVDLSTIPQFNSSPYTNTIRQQSIAYNATFVNTLNQAQARCPGLTIIVPDYYTLLNDLLARPAVYGVTNALDANGRNIDAMDDLTFADKSLNGPGANYIFWDYADPSAKVHYIMANFARQYITPAPPALPPQIVKLTVLNGSNRVDMANLPLGMNGLVEGCTNLLAGNWTTCGSFTNGSQSVFVPSPVTATNQVNVAIKGGLTLPPGLIPDVILLQFYRLSFPINYWVWP